MIRWIDRRLARRSKDEGLGMILVIGTLVFITTLVAVAASIAMNSIVQSDNRVTYEQALATAENGVDFTLGKLQRAFDLTNSDWPTPADVATQPDTICDSAVINQTATTDSAQKAEARANLLAIAANPACRQKAGVGEYVVWKPPTPLVNGLYPKYGKVYAMGFVPSYDPSNPRMKTRMLKAEYLFMPWRPTNAVLTSGNLVLDSSTAVKAAYGVDPSLASVHTNGTIDVDGNPTVTGQVSSTGETTDSSTNFTNSLNPGGAVAVTSEQRVPPVSALGVYFRALSDHPEFDATWYDLCPDGSARPRSTGGPCTAPDSATLNPGALGSFRGWTYTSSTHMWTASSITQDGIYFVHDGSVNVASGNGEINNITVIAEAENADNCASKRYGNIEWDHYGMKAPAFTNLFMYADSDILTHSNFFAGQGISTPPVISGMFVAGDQLHMETSSQGAVGSVVVGDNCTVGNPDLVTTTEIKNPEIYYDPNSESPFTSVISTTLWLEYND